MGMGTPINQSRPARAISTSNWIWLVNGFNRIKFLGWAFAAGRLCFSASRGNDVSASQMVKPHDRGAVRTVRPANADELG